MNSHITPAFRSLFAKLPQNVQAQARDAYRLFIENPWHPGLRFKKIVGTENVYSVRINLDYRAVGVLKESSITWFWIGSHSDYDKLLAQK